MNDQHDLQVLIESRVPIVQIETHEESRVLDLLERLSLLHEWPLFSWSVTEGIRRRTRGNERVPETDDPEAALRHIDRSLQNGLYALLDFHPFLDNPVNVRLLRNIALGYEKTARTLLLISPKLKLPDELSRLAARFTLAMPDTNAVRALIQEEAARWSRNNRGERLKAHPEAHELLVQHVAGLPYEDARRLIREAIHHDGAITLDDVPRVVKAKQSLVNRDSLLEIDFDTRALAGIGGLAQLKRWLVPRKAAFMNPPEGLPPPRGVLLLGVQGGGKSLAARAIAGAWGVPLARLDVGALYNKYHGETERNLREALKAAEAMAPCVLWMDEIEKGVAPTGSDEGVSRRVLGTLLTWMAEHRSRVFLVGTANAVHELPPELLRKGRFDEIFFVDLPDAAARREIFAIHLARRKQDAAGIDVAALAAASEGFSGAEIEQAVVAALYQTQGRALATDDIANEIRATRPLSVVMAEGMAALREWARGRTVPA